MSNNQIYTIIAEFKNHNDISFTKSNFSHNTLLREDFPTPIITSSYINLDFVIFESQETFTSLVNSYDHGRVSNSLFLNNSIYKFYSFLISSNNLSTLMNSVFINNNISTIEINTRALFVSNCTIDNKNLSNGFELTVGSTSFINNIKISCYELPIEPAKNKSLIIGIIAGCGSVLVIIIIGILIYAIKMKRLAIQEKHKSEISQLIINDFG